MMLAWQLLGQLVAMAVDRSLGSCHSDWSFILINILDGKLVTASQMQALTEFQERFFISQVIR